MAFSPDDPDMQSDDPRPDLDPAVGDQVSTLILTTGQHNFQINSAMARNEVCANAIGLTLGVQRGNMAMLRQQTELGVTEAHSAANLTQNSLPQQLAFLGVK